MRLKAAYGQVLSRVGDPLDKAILIGPLHSAAAVKSYQDTLSEAVKAGGTIEFGGNVSCLFLTCFIVHCSQGECIVVRSWLCAC